MDHTDEKKIRDTVNFYNGFSDKYDSKLSAYLNHTHKQLLDQIGDVSGERILDISCGTGLFAEQLMKRYTRMEFVLNDPSDGMRAIAESRLKGKADVEFSDQSAEVFTYEPNSFDRVICLNSFHYYSDQQQAIQRMYDVLKPGGSLYVLDWNREGWFHLPNLIVSVLSKENINSRSLPEVKVMLKKYNFGVQFDKRWNYRFWKFFLVEVKK